MARHKPYWYYLLKFSWPGKLFTRIRHPEIKTQQEQTFQYYSQLPGISKGLVFDIGANVGDLTAVFLQMGNRVVACEPDPENLRILTARFQGEKKVIVRGDALSDRTGTAKLFLSPAHGRSLSTLSVKRKEMLHGLTDEEGQIQFDAIQSIHTVTLDELIKVYGLPDFIKIDVEGLELEVLRGLSKPVSLLSFEANLPAFYAETLQCLQLLFRLDSRARFNCSKDDRTLLFSSFQPYKEFVGWFEKQPDKYFEIFCMSGEV
ncbi:FkbM family methyltransferase [Flavihumibacter profundi]|uniref:FkbM family methyltransferase n=1 Tax=Flavihumibacter profundi TaxID=2716883 RepID=UPI001CC49ECD|nr:FkbM family methyltransferase [Flavihumibacter profundi]MBZ5857157.1 FkbM family methyltransferase [Flavihumibacter profundi]